MLASTSARGLVVYPDPPPSPVPQLERRLAEVEADNQRLRVDNQRLNTQVRRLTERLAQYEPDIRHEATRPDSDAARPSD